MQELLYKPAFTNEQADKLFGHFRKMMGPYGLYQHATIKEPLLSEGYCVDDNARAVQVLLHLQKSVPEKTQIEIDQLIDRCWQFLFTARTGQTTYHNFRTAEGEWLTHDVSADMYARLLHAFTDVLVYDKNTERRAQAAEMCTDLIDGLRLLQSPRALGEIALALTALPESHVTLITTSLLEQVVHQLVGLWQNQSAEDWPWFEPTMSYANAVIPHGLLHSAYKLANKAPSLEDIVKKSTDFLLAATIYDGVFQPVGNIGWYTQGQQQPARYDQQPIEAGTMFDFLIDYKLIYPDRLDATTVAAPYLWFWGQNTNHYLLVDQEDGACFDGILENRPNRNTGAESMLAYLWSEVRLLDASSAVKELVASKKEELIQTSIK